MENINITTIIMALLATGLIFICILYILPAYILGAIGLMKIADRLKIKHSFLAWIPLANIYLLGKIAYGNIYGWILVISCILSPNNKNSDDTYFYPTTISSICGLAFTIMFFISLYKLYGRFSNKATIMIIFTVLTGGLVTPFFIFAIRNNKLIKTS